MKKIIYALSALAFTVASSNAQTNYLDSYIGNPVTLTTIGTSANQVNQPRDLDFKPNTNELWVCNYGNTAGGTMIIFYNAGLSNQTSEYRHDTHSDHFFYYPSAIALSDKGHFTATSEIQNTSFSYPTFMGPSLWLSDTAIFARVFQNDWVSGYPLGSHIDMLHQSPFAMGIAYDSALAYWVMDGYNGNICKYDFVKDHGPGYDDHSAGKIWRYSDVTVSRVPQVPSHLVVDKANGWLYFIDGGSKKVKRMNINSGTNAGTLPVPNSGSETLAGYWNMLGATVETIDTYATQPCGVDYYNGRLIVSDYTTGDIYMYNTTGSVTLVDTIVTGHPGMMGLKVGPDGHIWCVNKTESKVYRLDAALPTVDASIINITSPSVENCPGSYYSTTFNVCDGSITPAVIIANTGSTTINTMQVDFSLDDGAHTVYNWGGTLTAGNTVAVTLPSDAVTSGYHRLDVIIMSVNGAADDVDLNNTMTGAFRATSSVQAFPYTENFSSPTFPPANMNYIHFNPNNFMKRAAVSAFGNGSGSMRMDNYTGDMDITGQKDYMMLPLFDLRSAGSPVYLHFDVAYARYNNNISDELQVVASTDCGATWTPLYDKTAAALATAPNSTSSFTPTSLQWRTDTVDLSAYAGQPEVMIMFTNISSFANNLYIDNITVGSMNVGVQDIAAPASFSVFPNPASSSVQLSFSKAFDKALDGTVFSSDGRLVKSFAIPAGDRLFVLDLSGLANGIYAVKCNDAENNFGKIIVKQ